MGYEFNDNGKFVGWSNLFRYSSIEALNASQYLPTPTLTNYYKSPTGYDISELVLRIVNTEDVPSKIMAYADLIRELLDLIPEIDGLGNKKLAVTWNPAIDKVAEQVRKELNKHEFTKLSPLMIESAYKNSVSSNIQNIIQNPRNMDAAYSPIEMEGIRAASNTSPKGNLASNMTLMNPTTKYAMLVQNMVGKGVIGITAVGEKVFFNTSHYWNEGIRSNNERWINNLKFSLTFYRILGRASGNIEPITKTVLANVNFENYDLIRLRFIHINDIDLLLRQRFGITDVDILQQTDKWKLYREELINEVKVQLDIETSADLLISELLSAATDNAKELILDKINAGTNLARMYLHLIMMGFSIQDIVSFMISPVVSIINNLSEANMFDEYVYEMKVGDAANMVKGIIKPSLFFLGTSINSATGESSNISSLAFTVLKKIYKKDPDPETGKERKYSTLQELILDVITKSVLNQTLPNIYDTLKDKKIKVGRGISNNIQMFSDYVDSLVLKIINGVRETEGKDYKSKYTAFQEDLDEFNKVWSLATETSTLGSGFLGLNQGLPTSKQDLMSKLRVLERAVGLRESEFGIVLESFTPKEGDSKEMLDKKKEKLENIILALADNNSLLDIDYIRDTFNKARELLIINNFNITSWLLDDYVDYNGSLIRYRDAVSDYYNIIKGTWNIFDIIEKLPQYRAIFDLFKAVYIADAYTSLKSHIVNLISDKIIEDSGFMDKLMTDRLLRYVDDLLITKWLKESNFRFPVFSQSKYFNKYVDRVTATDNTFINLSTSSGRASFKLLMELEVIPSLKNGYLYDIQRIKNPDGSISLNLIRKDVPPNAFILGLVDAVDNGVPYKKLDIDMLNVNSTPSNTIKFLEYLEGLFKLKNVTLNEKPLSDWFMIYNFIVNLNRYGSDKMTTLFKSFIKLPGNDSSIIKKYFQTTGDLDYSAIKSEEDLEDLGFNIDDAFIRIAPNISPQQERVSKSRIIRLRTKDGIVYKKRTASGGYVLIPILPKKVATGDGDYLTRNQRMRDFLEYFTMLMPSADATIMTSTMLSSTNIDEVIQALIDYTSNGTIKIYKVNC